jgi:Ca2+-transporting ATPase
MYGRNQLSEVKPRSVKSLFFVQFKSVLILILAAAAALAASVGEYNNALVIFCVVLINASVGFYQEYRAEQSLTALKQMLPQKTTVKRQDQKIDIDAEDVVPGDLVLLEAGDKVPADGRLVMVVGVCIDESSLTGESIPVNKTIEVIVDENAALGDRLNMAFMNTLLTKGRGELLVTATGQNTEMGAISSELSRTEETKTPLQAQLDKLGKVLGAIALTLVSLLSFFSWLRGSAITDIILEAIALAVAAIPEGLPVVVTVTLALGMHKMARNKAIVKRLASVETLGCTTVICSDKTGTLTLNQMTVRSFFYAGRRFNVTGEGYAANGVIQAEALSGRSATFARLLAPCVACNDSNVSNGTFVGDPMEAALLVLGEKGGVSQLDMEAKWPRAAEIPFDAQHKYMATFHENKGGISIFVKGAPDVLLDMCSQHASLSGEEEISQLDIDEINSEYLSLANDGLRGLLIASKTITKEAFKNTDELCSLLEGLTFIGLIGLMDPPRPEVQEAIAECQDAGIAVKMITGDHKSTGLAVARELGLHGNAITGAELDLLDSAQLAEIIDETVVFARVSPEHKVKIVRALQAQKHIVAMTGDGVNDAPALKSADIGIAMGITGTEVAKEAATMILVDDNFATIVKAVHRGRTLYDNILKFVRFQLSTTIGAILTVFFAPLAALPDPFTPVQILWVAIIMDGPPAISLALDSSRPGIMQEKPRSSGEPILPATRLAIVIAYGIAMMIGTVLVLDYGMATGSEERALTLAFTTFVLFQVFNVFNARNESGTAFNRHLFDNNMLWFSLITIVVLQIVAVHWPPLSLVFGTVAISSADWLIAAGVASSILVIEELRKSLLRLAGLGLFPAMKNG